MKPTHRILFSIIAIGTLSVLAAQAGTAVVLEGFEHGYTTNSQGITNLAPFTLYGTPRGAPCSVSIYTSAGPGDPRVTEGTHSAKIVFPTDGFGNDFEISLSDAACLMIETAAAAKQPGRYILRYDVILENTNLISYFNQHWFVANTWNYVRSGGGVSTNYGGEQFEIDSYSLAVELPEVAMPTNLPSGTNAADFASATLTGVTGFLSDQFAAATPAMEPLNNFTIYIDNIRLIDTYETPTTTPVVYPLQSFENPASPTGGATNLQPSIITLSPYTTNGLYNLAADGGIFDVCSIVPANAFIDNISSPPSIYTPAEESDFAVSDGTNCLQVATSTSGYTQFAFSLPLAGTRLQQILNLNLTPAQLAHYTIRWDLTSPYVPFYNASNGAYIGGGDGDYFQLDYNATTGSILPMSNGRRQSDNQFGLQRQTYSETLDQILYWGTSPALCVSTSTESYWDSDPFYFDNFRLLDTAPKYTVITSESYNSGTKQFTLTWLSEPSQTYTVQFSSSLNNGFTSNLATGVPSGGDYTTTTVTVPGGTAGYLRILTQ
jgi:hypothetical protein